MLALWLKGLFLIIFRDGVWLFVSDPEALNRLVDALSFTERLVNHVSFTLLFFFSILLDCEFRMAVYKCCQWGLVFIHDLLIITAFLLLLLQDDLVLSVVHTWRILGILCLCFDDFVLTGPHIQWRESLSGG